MSRVFKSALLVGEIAFVSSITFSLHKVLASLTFGMGNGDMRKNASYTIFAFVT
jgi:hypothetical protein